MDKDNLVYVIAACVIVLILFVFMIFLIKYDTVRECIRVNPNNAEICAHL